MKLENVNYSGDNLTWLKKQSSFIYNCDSRESTGT